jgi:dTDP-4-amino-4,6-dideoxygalactose transaminase
MTATSAKLAINGGEKSVTADPGDMFTWPIVTNEDEGAVLDVLRRGAMSGTEISKQFEREYADWLGAKYALAYCNGTASLHAAMWACGVGAGDEIICPSITYWASAAAAQSLGAAVNFADIDPGSLCIDPADIEHRIGSRTKAIVVVHYAGHPCDMDAIMPIARKHKIKVIEDASHAHGSLYKGKMCGNLGDIAGMSMMSGKSFAAGELGLMTTNDRELYERCIAFGHYERTGAASNYNAPDAQITLPYLQKFSGVPIGGYKHRANQLCTAMARVQLKHYPARIAEIDKAMKRFWSLLEGAPGLRPQYPKWENSSMGGWYACRGLYDAKQLGGLPCVRFCEAVCAEGVPMCNAGANKPLHLHPVFHEADLFNQGQPTCLAFGQRDVRQKAGSLPVSERIAQIAFGIPWFKHDRADIIAQYAQAYRKVAENAGELL